MWAFLGLSGAAGGGFVRVREVLAWSSPGLADTYSVIV